MNNTFNVQWQVLRPEVWPQTNSSMLVKKKYSGGLMRKVWKIFFWENHKLSKEGAPGWYQHLHRSLHLCLNGSISSHCMSNEPNNIQILGHQCLFQRRPCLIHQHFCLNMGVFLTSFSFSKVGCKYQILQPKAPQYLYAQSTPYNKTFYNYVWLYGNKSDSQIDLPNICLDLLYEPCARR